MNPPVEVRDLAEEDLDAYFAIRAQAFGRPRSERAAWRERVMADRDAARLGAYVGPKLVGALRVLPGGQWMSGHRVSMGGVAGVVVAPEVRGRGVARALLFGGLEWMRERELAVSALHPASTRVYRGAGWEVAGDQESVAVRARSLAAIRIGETRAVEPAERDDWPELRECYARSARSRHGFVDRSESFWLLREPPEAADGWFTYAVRGADGVSGYVRYEQQPTEGWGYRLRVDDFVADDLDSAASLWRFLGGHGMQVEHIEVPGPAVDQLLLLLDEQDLATLAVNRWMHRIVDLPAAFAQRGYSPNASGSVAVAVTDPWPLGTSGSWMITVGDGYGAAAPAASASITLDIGALSAVTIGRFSVGALAAAGRIDGPDDEVARLGDLLAAPTPQLTDDF